MTSFHSLIFMKKVCICLAISMIELLYISIFSSNNPMLLFYFSKN